MSFPGYSCSITCMSRTYTATAKWFHWLIVLLVGLELLIGVIMPGVRRNTTPDTLVNLHFSFGLTIIAVMILRVLWRLTHSVPPLPRGTTWWEGAAAHLMHLSLYVLLFIIPFAGWAWTNAVGWQVVAFWIIPMPNIVPRGWQYTWLAADAHVYLAVLICVLIGLHILASLWHWYARNDGVLERMLPKDRYTKRALKYFDAIR
jgi:cytochrome b561